MDDERDAGLTGQQHAASPRECLCAGQGVVDQVFEGDLARGQRQGSGFDAGKLEQVVDHAGEPTDLGADLPVVAVRVDGYAVLQRLGHRVQSCEGRAQVVRDPGHELAARLIQRVLPRARLLQLLAGDGEFMRQRGELGRHRSGR